MLLHRKGKLTIAKSKSSRLSYSEVVSLPLGSIISKIPRDCMRCPYFEFIGIYQLDIHVIVRIMIVDGQNIIDISKCMVEGHGQFLSARLYVMALSVRPSVRTSGVIQFSGLFFYIFAAIGLKLGLLLYNFVFIYYGNFSLIVYDKQNYSLFITFSTVKYRDLLHFQP